MKTNPSSKYLQNNRNYSTDDRQIQAKNFSKISSKNSPNPSVEHKGLGPKRRTNKNLDINKEFLEEAKVCVGKQDSFKILKSAKRFETVPDAIYSFAK